MRFCAGSLNRGLCKARLQDLRAGRAPRTPSMPRGHTKRRSRSSTKEREVIRARNLLRRVRGLRWR